jgi:murein L,D-transpeptidase YcbB/YkuD
VRLSNYDHKTAAWVPAYHSSNFDCWLARGSRNAGVGRLQRMLNDVWGSHTSEGYRILAVDNDYGANTQAMVKWAQRQYGIGDDGVYGPQTRNSICWTSFSPEGYCIWFK